MEQFNWGDKRLDPDNEVCIKWLEVVCWKCFKLHFSALVVDLNIFYATYKENGDYRLSRHMLRKWCSLGLSWCRNVQNI